MTLFRTIITITALVHVTYGKTEVITIAVDLPNFFKPALLSKNDSKKTFRTSVDFIDDGSGLNVNVNVDGAIVSTFQSMLRFLPLLTNSYGLLNDMKVMRRFLRSNKPGPEAYFTKLANLIKERTKSVEDLNKNVKTLLGIKKQGRRMEDPWPHVEIAPGAFKSEQVTYPPKFFQSRLKHLIKIKEREKAMDG